MALTPTEPSDLSALVADLAAACDTLTRTVLRDLRPDLAFRLASGARPFVVVRTDPLSVGVFADVPGAEPIGLAEYPGGAVPTGFDANIAAFIERQLAGLSTEQQHLVADRLKSGGRLAVVVDADPFAVELRLFVANQSFALGRIGAGEPQHLH